MSICSSNNLRKKNRSCTSWSQKVEHGRRLYSQYQRTRSRRKCAQQPKQIIQFCRRSRVNKRMWCQKLRRSTKQSKTSNQHNRSWGNWTLSTRSKVRARMHMLNRCSRFCKGTPTVLCHLFSNVVNVQTQQCIMLFAIVIVLPMHAFFSHGAVCRSIPCEASST